MGGSKGGSWRTTPSMFMQCRILNQTVGHRVPVAEELVVLRNAEDAGVGERELRGVVIQGGRGPEARQWYENFQVLEQALRERVLHSTPCLDWRRHGGRHELRPRAENPGREGVQARGFVESLERLPPEQLVAPVHEIVDVAHDHRLLIRGGPQTCGPVGAERMGAPVLDLGLEARIGVAGREALEETVRLIGGVALAACFEEWQRLPVAARRRAAGPARRWVEDEVEPLLRFGEALVLAQLRRDQERDVEE